MGHPLTYKYLNELENFTGVKIHKTSPAKSMLEIIKEKLPNDRYRHCNIYTKEIPTRHFLRNINDDVLLYSGVRYINIQPNDIYDKRYMCNIQSLI
jgi:3'-phosphoadenosine 5'-phosphosulfate sulfotransferase (PAPS reductase)/FAD synthetase